MFFPDRISKLPSELRVLEVGPGGTPFPRSDVLLEKNFDNEAEAKGQRGHAGPLATDREVVFYDGGRFPFEDGAFDYVICSHVLEHVPNVNFFCSELCRVAQRGYLEYPTVLYDYLYDFPEHMNYVHYDGRTIYWMPKCESCLASFRPVTDLFRASLVAGHTALVDGMKELMFQGFEWRGTLHAERTRSLTDVCANDWQPTQALQRESWTRRLRRRVWSSRKQNKAA